MRSFTIVASAFAALAAAQTPNLQAALTGNSNLSSLAGLLTQNPALLTALNGATNITVLAPDNNALSALLNSTAGAALAADSGAVAALLQYHVLNGSYAASQITNTSAFIPSLLTNTTYTNVTRGQRVQALRSGNSVVFYSALLANSTVSQPVNFTGGVIHIINNVLRLPYSVSRTAADAGLSSLYGALNATSLLTTVNGLRDATIFAPNNAAFQSIGSIFANASVETLQSVLSYHAVAGTTNPYYSTDLANNTVLKSVEGTDLTIYRVGGSWFVNNAKILMSDVLVSGGVVHVIDNVLNPQQRGGVPTNAAGGSAAFSGASSVTTAPFTSGVPSATNTVGSIPTGGAGSSSSSSAAGSMVTGGVGVAALFGGAAFLANF